MFERFTTQKETVSSTPFVTASLSPAALAVRLVPLGAAPCFHILPAPALQSYCGRRSGAARFCVQVAFLYAAHAHYSRLHVLMCREIAGEERQPERWHSGLFLLSVVLYTEVQLYFCETANSTKALL